MVNKNQVKKAVCVQLPKQIVCQKLKVQNNRTDATLIVTSYGA